MSNKYGSATMGKPDEDNTMLVEGKWEGDWQQRSRTDQTGRFIRETSTFRHWITSDGSAGPSGDGGFKAEPGRYHLYVALNCPWACRALIYRKLKKLDDVISLSVTAPEFTDQGYGFREFEGSITDPIHNVRYLHELYAHADPKFTGRPTVPVLWDKKNDTMVNNESGDIIRMFNFAFDSFGDPEVDFYPAELRSEIDALNDRVYEGLNNGVYRAGLASSQASHEQAAGEVFGCLDELEERLAGQSYLLGERITETDWRVFVTLIRFDVAYHGLFKCNLKHLLDYPNLSRYLKRLYDVPGVAETVDFNHIKRTYYSIRKLNPDGIMPLGPLKIFPDDT
ncbi:MAG: putative glutathione S-transferase [Gammaproteobacteria bacterium]